MVLKLAIIETNQMLSGKAEYLSDGYSLEYKVDCYPVSYRYFLMCDTFTITFDRLSKDFVSFDDYAPKKCWKHTDRLNIPQDYKIGTLIVLEGFEEYIFSKSIASYNDSMRSDPNEFDYGVSGSDYDID